MNKNKYIVIGAIVIIIVLLGVMSVGKRTDLPNDTTEEEVVMTSPTPAVTPTPVITTKATPVSVNKTPAPTTTLLLKVNYVGGTCLGGTICTSEKLIYRSSAYYIDGVKKFQANSTDVAKLSSLIETTDFNTLRTKPVTGTCPTSHDAQEITYTFYGSGKTEVISNCKYVIDFKTPIFSLVKTMLPQY